MARVNTASGTSTEESRWPAPVLSAPRGIREITWHLGVVAAVTLVLALKGGWFVLPWVGIVCWILNPTPRQLIKVAAIYFTLGLTLAWLLSPRSITEHLTGALLWTDLVAATILDGLVHFFVVLAIGAATVAVLLSYDRRRVNRRVVDHRVWDRQVRRRRQLMRRWAWGRQLPEVLP